MSQRLCKPWASPTEALGGGTEGRGAMNGEQLSVGIDIIEIDRIARTLARFGDRFLRRVYTEAEVVYCRGKHGRLAARFAAKEAAAKALGVGIFWREGVYWRDVEVIRDYRGKPGIRLHGGALERAQQEGLTCWARISPGRAS